MKAAARAPDQQPAEAKPEAKRPVPEFREEPTAIGYKVNDYSIVAPDKMTLEDLTDPAAWALIKQNTRGFALAVGDSVRVVHRDWFATVLVDKAARNEPCHVLVQFVTKRGAYAAISRDLVPADHDVDQDPITGRYKAIFIRGDERIELGEHSTYQAAADQCRDHASRVAAR